MSLPVSVGDLYGMLMILIYVKYPLYFPHGSVGMLSNWEAPIRWVEGPTAYDLQEEADRARLVQVRQFSLKLAAWITS